MNFIPLLLLLLVTSASSPIDEVFTEQPGPSPLFIPTGTPAQLNCSVIDGYSISWAVRLPGSAPDSVPVLTSSAGVLSALMEMGITIQNTSSSTVRSSQLTVGEAVDDEDNNGTMAACVAVSEADVLETCTSKEVQVIYFGPPSTPTNLMANENGVGSLRISWSSPFPIDGVIVEFTLTATNLNASSSLPITVAGIQEQFYIFTVENATSCDVHKFQVMASNGAGRTNFSEILTSSLPSLSDISAVEDSLEQSLVKTADGVTLSVMFQGITSCPEYPVTSYTLVLVDSKRNESRESSAVTSGEITLVVGGLMEDAQFSYSIVAANVIGDSVSTVQNITTTDVQGVSICLVENITYSIQCSYITGSDARGCVYTLVSGVEGVANITGTIDRNSSEGMQVDLPNVGCYRELLVFDWERDNSTGTVPIRGNFTSDKMCPFTGPPRVTMVTNTVPTTSSSGLSTTVIVSLIVAVSSLLLVVTILSVIIAVTYFRKQVLSDCVIHTTASNNNDEDLYAEVQDVPPEDKSHMGSIKAVVCEENPSYQTSKFFKAQENPSYGVMSTGNRNNPPPTAEYEVIDLI